MKVCQTSIDYKYFNDIGSQKAADFYLNDDKNYAIRFSLISTSK